MIGLPMYGDGRHAPQALESLLAQTCRDLAVVITDDGGGGRERIGDALADDRVTYRANSRRLGLTGNWRRAYELARDLHPSARYFAWGSDHDVWHPEWLERLGSALAEDDDAVLAYGLRTRLSAQGKVHARSWHFDTRGISDAPTRVALTARRMAAGYMIYGLFRSTAPGDCGVFRSVLMPDRLLLSETSVLGTFLQVDEPLWYRRKQSYSKDRQRSALFPDRVPVGARVTWWISHPLCFASQRRRWRLPRRERLRVVAAHWTATLALAYRHATRRIRRTLNRIPAMRA